MSNYEVVGYPEVESNIETKVYLDDDYNKPYDVILDGTTTDFSEEELVVFIKHLSNMRKIKKTGVLPK